MRGFVEGTMLPTIYSTVAELDITVPPNCVSCT